MSHGKPFTKVSEEQRAAFGAAAKRDAVELLKDLGVAGVQHLQDNPNSVISSTLRQVEQDTGALTVLARGIKALVRERAESGPKR